MKILTSIFLVIVLTILTYSCERAKNKTKEVASQVKEKTKAELREQIQRGIDKVFPPFDHDKPDTENNKQRFKDFIKVDLTEDIINIYCFDDAIGADADYMFSFNCNESTSNRIIKTHNLTIDTINKDNGFGLQHEFDWWDRERISQLQKYSWTNKDRYFKYYWYDKENEKAYFFDFDL